MGYWPSYSQLSSANRTAYLDWIANGRGGAAYIGYVFLFFYGIERRVLVDAVHLSEARAEVPVLLAEVERLLGLYGESHSFNGYARNFLATAKLLHGSRDVSGIEPPMEPAGWDFPVELKVALGTFVAHGEPVPAVWALSWLRSHPAASLRTPALRCPDQFNELFKIRYAKRYPEGMRVRGRRKLQLSYHPASASFHGSFELKLDGLVDVTTLEKPLADLRAVADDVCNSLDSYSRWVGKRDDRESLAALGLLPSDLPATKESPELRALTEKLNGALGDDGIGVVQTRELMEAWPAHASGKFTKAEATVLLESLERHGFGIEPDVRYGGANWSAYERAAIFRYDPPHSAPGEQFHGAATVLKLAAAVVLANGVVGTQEQDRLDAHFAHELPMTAPERYRLRALTRWLLAENVGLNGLRSPIAALGESQRVAVGQFLVSVAAADGSIVPSEIAVLERAYRLLGLDPDGVHRDIHAVSTGDDSGPPTVLTPDTVPTYQIPAAPTAITSGQPAAIVLDLTKIERIMASSAEVTGILEAVFKSEDDDAVTDTTDVEPEDDSPQPVVAGLDAAHSRLVEYLAERRVWPRADFDALATRLNLMPAGAIEVVNELAFERCGTALLEGDNPVEVDPAVVEELVRGH